MQRRVFTSADGLSSVVSVSSVVDNSQALRAAWGGVALPRQDAPAEGPRAIWFPFFAALQEMTDVHAHR